MIILETNEQPHLLQNSTTTLHAQQSYIDLRQKNRASLRPLQIPMTITDEQAISPVSRMPLFQKTFSFSPLLKGYGG